jgi:uncharacterized iron-regulated membrane protein
MDSISGLSGQLMGLWLAIIAIAIVFGILYAIGSSLVHWKGHGNRTDQRGEPGSRRRAN